MTFSISARCHRTGDLGVAITTAWFAVGSICPAARVGVGAVASQARANSALRGACLDRIAAGEAPQAALREALAADAGAVHRQVGLIDAAGRTAAYTGAECIAERGALELEDAVIAGNMLASQNVLSAMAAAWTSSRSGDLRLAERMLAALDAGQAAGGDMRGKQSAALLIASDGPSPDLRVDDAPEPLLELRRLLSVYRERYEPIYLAMRAAAAAS